MKGTISHPFHDYPGYAGTATTQDGEGRLLGKMRAALRTERTKYKGTALEIPTEASNASAQKRTTMAAGKGGHKICIERIRAPYAISRILAFSFAQS
jgi:hypothetical protein